MEPDWDQLSIDTPELVAIEMPVAGIGSRFVALLIDYLIWAAILVAFGLLVALIDPSLNEISEKWAAAIFILIPFLLYWGYFTLFEAFWNGRTPGKRVLKIRVIQRTGRGIGLFEAMTRNLLRIVDQFPFCYAVGVVSIFLTRDHQRLGDLAAGTLVVHERENLIASGMESSGRTITAGLFASPAAAQAPRAGFDLAATGLHRLGAQDLEVLEGFLARRLDLNDQTRQYLAGRIAQSIFSKAGLAPPPDADLELYLEEVARRLRDVARIQ